MSELRIVSGVCVALVLFLLFIPRVAIGAETFEERVLTLLGRPAAERKADAEKSGLISRLERGHEEVKLSTEEMEKLACWIDLAVPYCGDYTEANIWTEADSRLYDRHMSNRMRATQN